MIYGLFAKDGSSWKRLTDKYWNTLKEVDQVIQHLTALNPDRQYAAMEIAEWSVK